MVVWDEKAAGHNHLLPKNCLWETGTGSKHRQLFLFTTSYAICIRRTGNSSSPVFACPTLSRCKLLHCSQSHCGNFKQFIFPFPRNIIFTLSPKQPPDKICSCWWQKYLWLDNLSVGNLKEDSIENIAINVFWGWCHRRMPASLTRRWQLMVAVAIRGQHWSQADARERRQN